MTEWIGFTWKMIKCINYTLNDLLGTKNTMNTNINAQTKFKFIKCGRFRRHFQERP